MSIFEQYPVNFVSTIWFGGQMTVIQISVVKFDARDNLPFSKAPNFHTRNCEQLIDREANFEDA